MKKWSNYLIIMLMVIDFIAIGYSAFTANISFMVMYSILFGMIGQLYIINSNRYR